MPKLAPIDVFVLSYNRSALIGETLESLLSQTLRPSRIVVLDNGHYGETGMQRSHSSLGSDLVAVAKGCGIADAFATGALAGSDEIAQRIRARAGTAFAQVFVEVEELPRTLPPRDGAFIKNRFRAALGLTPF